MPRISSWAELAITSLASTNGRRMRRTMNCTAAVTGENTRTMTFTIGATASANGSGRRIASVFGSTSEKMRTSAVMMKVA